MRPNFRPTQIVFSMLRLRLWYLFIVLAFLGIGAKLFYLQVIKHDHYKQAAYEGQFKEFEIPAERGVIMAHEGERVIPLVLNQDTYTLFADPKFIENPDETAIKVKEIIGGNPQTYAEKMRLTTRYAVLAKKLDEKQKEALDGLGIKGLGTRTVPIRAYPQGKLASQLLGFVNDEGQGTYGVEQFFDESLSGENGELKAITDAQGVPLVSTGSNILREPKPGERVTLTVDISMQRRIEEMLKPHLDSVNSASGSVIVMDPYSGGIKAMANYPSYDPAKFFEVGDASLFTNPSVSSPMEVGSVMKTLTMAAGLNEGAVKPDGKFYDPARITVDNETITNVEEDGGAAQRTIPDILRLSLNTGAVYILQQLGGGKINEKARLVWHDYLTDQYGFGKKTGVEQGYEAEGSVPNPKEGYGLNIQYANSTFGQGITVTPLQFISAYAATINGGNYFRPHLIEPGNKQDRQKLMKRKIIKPGVSSELRKMHQNSVNRQYPFLQRDGYGVGGKTGTPEIPSPDGGYYKDRFNGTFIGYVGGKKPEYAIMIRVNEPVVNFYAGTAAAAPLFGKVVDMLINNYSIRPL